MAGLTAFLAAFAAVMTTLKLVGAGYLLWLAFKLLRSASKPGDAVVSKVEIDGGFWRYYRRGLTIQMTNPKAMLSWIAVMSMAVDGTSPIWVGAVVVVGTGIYSVFGHLAYAIAFSTRPMVVTYTRARRWIEGGLGLFFCFASFKLATSRI